MAFVIYKGIVWTRRLTVTDEETGERTDLTGKTLVVQLRRRPGEAVILTADITELPQTGETLGQADAAIAAEDSAGLAVASHHITVLLDDQVVLPSTKLPVRNP